MAIPGPGLIVLSPAGFVMRVQESAPSNGIGTFGQVRVAPVLQGSGATVLDGVGDHPVSLSGVTGTMTLQVTTGALGATRSLAYIATTSVSPTFYIGVSLDSLNRPYAVITNALGVLVAQTAVQASSIPAGTPLTITLSWNSQAQMDGGSFALFSVNGVISNLWDKEAMTPWVSFSPTIALVGYGVGGSDFNGSIGFIQVTDTLAVVPAGVPEPHILKVLAAGLTSNSSVAADLTVV